jgi:cytochrome c-type biogenesis protein
MMASKTRLRSSGGKAVWALRRVNSLNARWKSYWGKQREQMSRCARESPRPGLLIAVALVLLVSRLNAWVKLRLSGISSRVDAGARHGSGSAPGQFGVGALLGVVWLPCVGPTLGAAIALAPVGQNMGLAFIVKLAYGVGTAGVLLLAGITSKRVLARWRPGIVSAGGLGKKLLGGTLLVLGMLVLTGVDKFLEALAVTVVPDWVLSL